MTTVARIIVNGSFVAEVLAHSKTFGTRSLNVGPGAMVHQDLVLFHGAEETIRITERAATPEEIAAAREGRKPNIDQLAATEQARADGKLRDPGELSADELADKLHPHGSRPVDIPITEGRDGDPSPNNADITKHLGYGGE